MRAIRNSKWMIPFLLFICALGVRLYQLDSMPTQNDEQLWLARAYSFVHTLFNAEPDITPLTKIYSDNGNVDVFEAERALVPEQYPFTIRTEAHHPGVPPTLLIGLSYVFLADGAHEASLNLLPTIVAIKLPQVMIGSLLVVVVFLGTSFMTNRRIGLIASVVVLVSPLMIGFSRFARIDMTAAFFATCMFFSYVVLVKQTKRSPCVRWAVSTGLFAGLGMATIPYAVYIVPIFAFVKILLSHPTKSKYRRFLPNRYDLLFLLTWLVIYVFAHPNLWANPIAGFELWLENTFARPHLQGEGNHLLYVQYFLLTTLPTTMLFAVLGTVGRLKRFWGEIAVLLVWIVWFLLLLSIPSGGKHLKNLLELSIPMAILAGIGIDWLAERLSQFWKRIASDKFLILLMFCQIVISLGAVAYWWPLPHLYIFPGVHIKLEDGVGIATSHGVKPALDYMVANSPIEPKRFIARSGRNNLLFYMPEEQLAYHIERELERSDWLIVLPKVYSNAQSQWYYNETPSHIIKHRQIELAYLYYLPDFYPREMIDTASPYVVYDNGIELYDIDVQQQANQLIISSWWGEQPDDPYGFTLQIFDVDNNKVMQGDFLLPTESKQESTLDISSLSNGSYRLDLIVYDLATSSSMGGYITETDSPFDRALQVKSIDIISSPSSDS